MTAPAAGKAGCPICNKPVDPVYKPFCSRRCADVDLQRWFSGGYAVPGAEVDEDAPGRDDDGGA